MNCLPLFSSELSPKRVGKWLSVASPSVPNLMEQIVAQRASPAHCLLPPAVGRREGIGGGVCLHCAVRETTFLLQFFFPSVSLNLPGGCCRCRSACRLHLASLCLASVESRSVCSPFPAPV